MGTTLEEDKKLMENERVIASPRFYFALKYRIELKAIVHQQIRLAKIALVILQRAFARGKLDGACGIVSEYEIEEGIFASVYE